MQIHGLHQSHAAQSIQQSGNAKAASSAQPAETSSLQQPDQLDLSPEALALSQAQAADASEIRMDKVASIRQAIADGVYETPEKLSQALDNMLDSFA